MKTKTKTLFFILTLFISTSLFASDCGKELDCPKGIKYPYTFCKFDGNEEYIDTTICTDDPFRYMEDNSGAVVRKVNLPIYVLPPGIGFLVQQFKTYKIAGSKTEITLFGDGWFGTNVLMENDLLKAANMWNCVCGDTVDLYNFKIGTLIQSDFSDNYEIFRDPWVTAIARMIPSVEQDENDGSFYCDLNYEKSRIFFNATPEFLYDEREFPIGNVPLKKGWVLQEYVDNANNPAISRNNVTLYNFLEVAMHEIGHILGFGHYTVLVSTYCYTFVKTGFYIILQLFFISLSIISKHKIKLM